MVFDTFYCVVTYGVISPLYRLYLHNLEPPSDFEFKGQLLLSINVSLLHVPLLYHYANNAKIRLNIILTVHVKLHKLPVILRENRTRTFTVPGQP